MGLNSIRGGQMRGDEYRVLNVPRVSVYRTAALNIAISTITAVQWDTLEYDNDSMWNASAGGAFRCNTPGLYDAKAWGIFASNATGWREVYLLKTRPDGTTVAYDNRIIPAATGAGTSVATGAHITLNHDDTVTALVGQNGASPLAFTVATAADRENGFQACLISTLG